MSQRHAALLLHAMTEADRRWMLDALPAADRGALEPLLAELHALGIPADRTLLDAVGDGPVDRLVALRPAEVAWLAQQLQREPPALAGQLLAQQAWPWREVLLGHFEATFRDQVLAVVPRPRPGQAAAAAVRRALEDLAPQPGPGRLPAWLRWWRPA